MTMKWILPAAGIMVLTAAACQPEMDVPVPDDPQAQEWNGSIKTAYPEWQPTVEAPQGNAEFEGMFAEVKQPEPSPVEVPQEPAPVDEAEKLKYPILYAPIPDKVRLDVAENGSVLVNGTLLPLDIVEKYLAAMVKSHGGNTAAILYVSPKTDMKNVNNLLDICTKTKIAGVSLKVAGESKAAGKLAAKPAEKKTARMVVDSSKPAAEYIVKKGDTLGSIALKQYKNAVYWPVIYNANKGKVKNPNRLTPKMKLQIPALKPAGGAVK